MAPQSSVWIGFVDTVGVQSTEHQTKLKKKQQKKNIIIFGPIILCKLTVVGDFSETWAVYFYHSPAGLRGQQ